MRRSLVLLLLVAALAPTSAMAAEWYHCRTTGETMRECCCPDVSGEEEPSRDDQMRAACCCDVERSVARTSEPRARADAPGVAALPPPAAIATRSTPPAALRAVDGHRTPALPRGPPVFLRNLTLLL